MLGSGRPSQSHEPEWPIVGPIPEVNTARAWRRITHENKAQGLRVVVLADKLADRLLGKTTPGRRGNLDPRNALRAVK
jgi:hypothetical protein